MPAPDSRLETTFSAISRGLAASRFFRLPPIGPFALAAARPADARSGINGVTRRPAELRLISRHEDLFRSSVHRPGPDDRASDAAFDSHKFIPHWYDSHSRWDTEIASSLRSSQ
jgi:hypothetical protein